MSYAPRALAAAGLKRTSDRVFKAYELAAPGQTIDDALRAAAWGQLPRLAAKSVDETTPAAGWCVLHRGQDGVYVVAYSWVWNEVVETHTAVAGNPNLGAGGDAVTDFGVLDRSWVGCVWELAPLEHERAAWTRHVLKQPEPDIDGYLADFFADGLY